MKENVIIVNFNVPEEAYAALKKLRKKPEGKGIKVSHAALVKIDGGELSLEDGFMADDVEDEYVWTGGLIGGMVGLLAGLAGALVAGGIGALLGAELDEEELKDTTRLLKKASECLVDGETAMLVLAECKDEAALAEKLKDYQVTLTCLDAKEIAHEIEHARKKAKKDKKGAKAQATPAEADEAKEATCAPTCEANEVTDDSEEPVAVE